MEIAKGFCLAATTTHTQNIVLLSIFSYKSVFRPLQLCYCCWLLWIKWVLEKSRLDTKTFYDVKETESILFSKATSALPKKKQTRKCSRVYFLALAAMTGQYILLRSQKIQLYLTDFLLEEKFKYFVLEAKRPLCL